MNRPPTPVPRRGPWPVFLLLLFALGLPSLRAGNPTAPAVALPPLLAAAERGELAAVRSALDAGVPVDTRDGRGWTALARGDVYGAQTALKRGAPTAGIPGAPPPLFAALAAGDPFLVGMLLDAGADPNARDAAGRTPLTVALARARDAVGALPSSAPATDVLRGQQQAIIDRLHQAGARE